MEVIWNQLIIALVEVAVVGMVVVEEADSIGKFACVTAVLYMCTEINVGRLMRDKFLHLLCSSFFNYLTRTKNRNYCLDHLMHDQDDVWVDLVVQAEVK